MLKSKLVNAKNAIARNKVLTASLAGATIVSTSNVATAYLNLKNVQTVLETAQLKLVTEMN